MRFDQASQMALREGVWWRPSVIGEIVDTYAGDRLLYVVVDDLDRLEATLVGYPWPEVSDAGTLLFGVPHTEPDGGEDQPEPGSGIWLAVDVDDGVARAGLQAVVSDHRRAHADRYLEQRPEGGIAPDRPLRVGDVFAFALEEPILAALDPATGKRQANIDLSSVVVYDITFEAREVSRAAFLAAIAPPLEESQLEGEKQAFDQAAEVHEDGVSDFGESSQTVAQVDANDAEIAGEASHQASPNV
jgi:hypothetical protein